VSHPTAECQSHRCLDSPCHPLYGAAVQHQSYCHAQQQQQQVASLTAGLCQTAAAAAAASRSRRYPSLDPCLDAAHEGAAPNLLLVRQGTAAAAAAALAAAQMQAPCHYL
jgi:hypothetical protein